jgi:hypothetical protein
MTGPGVVLGTWVGPFAGCVDAELARCYAPVAIVTQIWEAQNAGRA